MANFYSKLKQQNSQSALQILNIRNTNYRQTQMGCASLKLTENESRQLIKKFQHTAHVGDILNNIRKKPNTYIQHIERELKHFQKGKYVKIKTPQTCQEVQYETIQGPLAWKEAIKCLKSTYPISYPLIKNSVLTQAASKKAMSFNQKQQKASRSARYVPNAQLSEELKSITGTKVKHGQFVVLIGMDFKIKGRNYVQNALIGLIIDDGVPLRSNRKHMFSQKYKYYGSYTTLTNDYVIVVIYLSTENLARDL